MNKVIVSFFAIYVFFLSFANAQTPVPQYELKIKNYTKVSSTELQFDVYLKRTGDIQFEYAKGQYAIFINKNIKPAGGVLSIDTVANSSELTSLQKPVSFVIRGDTLIQVAARTSPGYGSPDITVIQNDEDGTRVARFKVMCTMPLNEVSPDLLWRDVSNSSSGYQTKIWSYVNTVVTEITNPESHSSQFDPVVIVPAPTYELVLKNYQKISSNDITFDLFLKRTGSEVFEYARGQYSITLNKALNQAGSTLTFSLMNGTSSLNATQVPSLFSVVGDTLLRIGSQAEPGAGNGTIISETGDGTKLGTFKVSGSLPLNNVNPYLQWNNNGNTTLNAYVNGLSQDVTTPQTHFSYVDYVAPVNPTYELVLKNYVKTSGTEIKFDVFLKRTGAEVFEYSKGKYTVKLNRVLSPEGSTLTFGMDEGTSSLNASQIPTSFEIIGDSLLVINAANEPGAGNGTIISETGDGTKLGTFKVVCSSLFNNQHPDLTWYNGNNYTSVSAYVNYLSTDITTPQTHFSYIDYSFSTPTYDLVIKNYQRKSTKEIQFDVYMKGTNDAEFIYAGGNFGMLINKSLKPLKGKLSFSMVSGTSELNAEQVPELFYIEGDTLLKVIGQGPTSQENSTVISKTGDGTKLGTFKLSCNMPFGKDTASIQWKNQDKSIPYSFGTYVDAYLNYLITDITTPETHYSYINGSGSNKTIVNIKAIMYGFYNSSTSELSCEDTVTAYLYYKSSNVYQQIGAAKGVIDPIALTGKFEFTDVPTGTYYIVLKHRNGLETWSKDGGFVVVKGATRTYDFTTSNDQAYGLTTIQAADGKWCIVNGDVNQDGAVNDADELLVSTGVDEFKEGYVSEDVTGNNVVDANDLSLIQYFKTLNLVVQRP